MLGSGMKKIITNSKFLQGLGDMMGGIFKTFRLDKMFNWIGETFNIKGWWKSNKVQKVFVEGGKIQVTGGILDYVRQAGAIGAVGAVDADAFAEINTRQDAIDTSIKVEKISDKASVNPDSDTRDLKSSTDVKPVDNVADNKTIQEADRVQDAETKKSKKYSLRDKLKYGLMGMTPEEYEKLRDSNAPVTDPKDKTKPKSFFDIKNSPIVSLLAGGGLGAALARFGSKVGKFALGLGKIMRFLAVAPIAGYAFGTAMDKIVNNPIVKFILPESWQKSLDKGADYVTEKSNNGIVRDQKFLGSLIGAEFQDGDFDRGKDQGMNQAMRNWIYRPVIKNQVEKRLGNYMNRRMGQLIAEQTAERVSVARNPYGTKLFASTIYSQRYANSVYDDMIKNTFNVGADGKIIKPGIVDKAANTRVGNFLINNKVSNKVSSTIGSVAEKASNVASKVSTATEKALGKWHPSSIASKLWEMFRTKKVAEFMAKEGVQITSKMLDEIAEKAAKEGLKRGGIAGLKAAASFVPYVNIAVIGGFFIADYMWGSSHARELFRLNESFSDVTEEMKTTAGLVHGLKGVASSSLWTLPLAFLPTEILIDIVYKYMLKDKGTVSNVEKGRIAQKKMLQYQNTIKDTDGILKALQDKDAPELLDFGVVVKAFDKENKETFYRSVAGTGNGLDNRFFREDKKEIKFAKEVITKDIKDDLKINFGYDLSSNMSKRIAKNRYNKSSTLLDWLGRGIDAVTEEAHVSKGTNETFLLNTFNKKKQERQEREQHELNKSARAMSDIYSLGKTDYKFGGFSYAEVGCGPMAIANVYAKFGLKLKAAEVASIAYYYQKLNGGKNETPFKMLIDYMVFDGLFCRFADENKPESDVMNSLNMGCAVIFLMKEPNGGSHYVSVARQTEDVDKDGNKAFYFMVYDPINSSGHEIRLQREHIVNSRAALIVSASMGPGSGWFHLFPGKINEAKSNPNFDWNKLGRFADINTFLRAKAYAAAKLTQDRDNFDINYFTKKATALIQKHNIKNVQVGQLANMLMVDALQDILIPSDTGNIDTNKWQAALVPEFNGTKNFVSMYNPYREELMVNGQAIKVRLNRYNNRFRIKPLLNDTAVPSNDDIMINSFKTNDIEMRYNLRGIGKDWQHNISKYGKGNTEYNAEEGLWSKTKNVFGGIADGWGLKKREDTSGKFYDSSYLNKKLNQGGGAIVTKYMKDGGLSKLDTKLQAMASMSTTNNMAAPNVNIDTATLAEHLAESNKKLETMIMLFGKMLEVNISMLKKPTAVVAGNNSSSNGGSDVYMEQLMNMLKNT